LGSANAGRANIGAASNDAVPANKVRRLSAADSVVDFFSMDALSLLAVLALAANIVIKPYVSQAD
jgi:hypothetical protein